MRSQAVSAGDSCLFFGLLIYYVFMISRIGSLDVGCLWVFALVHGSVGD